MLLCGVPLVVRRGFRASSRLHLAAEPFLLRIRLTRGGLKAAPRVWHNQEILYEADFFLNGNLAELERLAAEVSCFRAANSLSEEVEYDLNLALEELFVNSVRHGGCEGLEKSARVRIGWEGGAVAVEFSDRGQPFDVTRAPEADTVAPLADRRAGGFGIHLVRSLMCDVEYRRTGEWNQVTMKRPGSAAEAEEPGKDLGSR